MYFAKFFHKDPGDDDRLLLLAVDDAILMGIYMREVDSSQFDWSSDAIPPSEFLRQEFDKISEGVAAYRREAEKLRADGYIETYHTKYSLRDLGGDFTPKPEWQRALDEALMSAFADPPEVQAKRLAALKGTPAADEPTALWLAARYANDLKNDDVMQRVRQARDALHKYESAKLPYYTWSLFPGVIKANIYSLLSYWHLHAGSFDPAAALDAIEIARETYPEEDQLVLQAWILCTYFPEREEDAYDSIYHQASSRRYEPITSRPSYKTYADRRAADAAAKRGTWRWSVGKEPATKRMIAKAEDALGAKFPDDYRKFLQERGKCELFVRLPRQDSRLKFFAPGKIARSRERFIKFITITESEEQATQEFRDNYGVTLRHLIPIAEPFNVSNLLLLHTEPGEKYGHCYVWNHDGAWELVNEQRSFQAMLTMLLAGIEKQDRVALDLFDIYIKPGNS